MQSFFAIIDWVAKSLAALCPLRTVRDSFPSYSSSGVAKTTSFRWRHRFLTDLAELKATSLTGIVEADETSFPLSFKGSRQLPRLPHLRGHAIHQRGTGNEQVPVLVLRDRHSHHRL